MCNFVICFQLENDIQEQRLTRHEIQTESDFTIVEIDYKCMSIDQSNYFFCLLSCENSCRAVGISFCVDPAEAILGQILEELTGDLIGMYLFFF